MKPGILPLLGLLATLAGCGNSSPVGRASPGLPPGPVSCPRTGDLTTAAEILPERLVDEATLQRWQTGMVALGPRFTGSPAHQRDNFGLTGWMYDSGWLGLKIAGPVLPYAHVHYTLL